LSSWHTDPISTPEIHYMGKNRLCVTGRPARKFSPEKIVVGTEGFIPLWEKGVHLRYRLNERTFRETKRSKEEVLKVLNEAIKQWGDSAPITLVEDSNLWDFEISLRNASDCRDDGCSMDVQVSTLTHELGHIFGLRHWFAKEEDGELGWTSEVFGHNEAFTIMNYGEKSMLTNEDKRDLKLLYKLVWSGELKKINTTPIVLFKPYSAHSPTAGHR
ncbi:hypothetical protein BGZ68_006560, partial [Mortierella alpina]